MEVEGEREGERLRDRENGKVVSDLHYPLTNPLVTPSKYN